MKILTIDGGGLLGIGPARFLVELEKSTGKKCFELFDGFAGTSTGSIIAAALALGFPAKTVYDMYYQDAEEIFSRPWYRAINPFNSKYDGKGLKRCLDSFFGNKKMGDVKKPLYISTSDLATNSQKVWDRKDKHMDISYVVRSSCSAPTYFPPVDRKYCDGGMWCNSPTLIGLLGFAREMNVDISHIKVMSLGTNGYQVKDKLLSKDPGPLEWLKSLIPFFMVGTEGSVDFYMKNLPCGYYVRFEPLDTKNYEMDDIKAMKPWEEAWSIWWEMNETLCKSFVKDEDLIMDNTKEVMCPGLKTNIF